jgi:hypothetical protein
MNRAHSSRHLCAVALSTAALCLAGCVLYQPRPIDLPTTLDRDSRYERCSTPDWLASSQKNGILMLDFVEHF